MKVRLASCRSPLSTSSNLGGAPPFRLRIEEPAIPKRRKLQSRFKSTLAYELLWIAPFLCLGLLVLGLLRPLPQFTAPAHSRAVIGGDGVKIAIEKPFRGVVFTWCGCGAVGYLEDTHSPETIMNAGGPEDRIQFGRRLMSKVYPQVLSDNRYWDSEGEWTHKAKTEIERLMAYNPGAYLGDGGNFGMVPLLRRVGLPAISVSGRAENEDESDYQAVRAETSLTDDSERGEALIARHKEAVAELQQELRPDTLVHRPRVLVLGADSHILSVDEPNLSSLYIKSPRNPYQLYIVSAGADNASEGWTGERPDVERILAMDPDYIFLMWFGEGPQEFMHDPRWRGLKAVQNKRVYRIAGNPGGGGLMGLIFQPVTTRWMAEILHPDRLQPKTRQVLRDTYLTEFGYRLSDEQIDQQLWLNENAGSAGYERFERNYHENDQDRQSSNQQEPKK